MKKFLLSVALVMTATMTFAQVEKAKMTLDEIAGKNDPEKLAMAKVAINQAIASGKPNKMAYIYNVAGQVELRYLNQELDKMSAHEDLDTTLFINSMDKAVEYFLKSYEIDHTPDAKGKVKAKFDYGDKYTIGEHDGNLVWMKKILGYYLISAQFKYAQNDKDGAYKYYIKHLELPQCPMFTAAQTDSIYNSDDRYQKVGYFATIIAHEKKDYDAVLKTVDFAIQSDEDMTREDGYQMKSGAYLHKGDTAQWLNTVKAAIENTSNVNYSLNLLKYYYDHHMKGEVAKYADDFIERAPDNKMGYYIKGVYLMDELKDQEALKFFQTALEKDPNFADAQINIGTIAFNEVREIDKNNTYSNRDPRYKETQELLLKKLQECKEIFGKVEVMSPGDAYKAANQIAKVDELLEIVEGNLKEVAKLKVNQEQ